MTVEARDALTDFLIKLGYGDKLVMSIHVETTRVVVVYADNAESEYKADTIKRW